MIAMILSLRYSGGRNITCHSIKGAGICFLIIVIVEVLRKPMTMTYYFHLQNHNKLHLYSTFFLKFYQLVYRNCNPAFSYLKKISYMKWLDSWHVNFLDTVLHPWSQMVQCIDKAWFDMWITSGTLFNVFSWKKIIIRCIWQNLFEGQHLIYKFYTRGVR